MDTNGSKLALAFAYSSKMLEGKELQIEQENALTET